MYGNMPGRSPYPVHYPACLSIVLLASESARSWFRSSFRPWAWRQRSPEWICKWKKHDPFMIKNGFTNFTWMEGNKKEKKLSSTALPRLRSIPCVQKGFTISRTLGLLSVHLRFTYPDVSPLIWEIQTHDCSIYRPLMSPLHLFEPSISWNFQWQWVPRKSAAAYHQ